MNDILTRRNWAPVHTRWIRRRWNTVLFFFSFIPPDESRFSLHRGDARVRVIRRRNDCCILERNRFRGGGSVMVLAAIVHDYRSPLVVIDDNLNGQRNRYDIIAHHIIPLFHNNANISIVQHDNAITRKYY